MSDKVIFKIIDKEAKELMQKAMLLSDCKKDAAFIINEVWDEALRQLWKVED